MLITLPLSHTILEFQTYCKRHTSTFTHLYLCLLLLLRDYLQLVGVEWRRHQTREEEEERGGERGGRRRGRGEEGEEERGGRKGGGND